MDIYLKKDYMQYTGSFKERGARYTLLMLSDEQKKKGHCCICWKSCFGFGLPW